MKDKDSLRQHYKKLLKEQNKEKGAHKSRLIAAQLWELPVIQKAESILFYASTEYEVDTQAMIVKALLSGKKVALPVVERHQRKLIPTLISSMEDLHKGTYGIMEPKRDANKQIGLQDLEAVIVPGLAFDQHKHRLGHGAGYYDRFLSQLPENVVTIGLAFDFQLTDRLPTETHDMRLSQIIAA